MNHPMNPEDWQASNHPDLARREPGELFDADFALRYKKMHDDLRHRVLRLNSTINTLKTLDEFPFDFLCGPNEMEFWHLVGEHFVEGVIVLVHTLVNDQGDDALTLMRFKNVISEAKWSDQALKELYHKVLRDRKFDKEEKSIAERIEKIRHNRVAHRLMTSQTGDYVKWPLGGVTLQELRSITDASMRLFGAVSFGSSYAMLSGDLMPTYVGGQPSRSRLDKVLDAVVKDSYAVNEPELREEWLADERRYIDPGQLEVMNALRRRIGLPQA